MSKKQELLDETNEKLLEYLKGFEPIVIETDENLEPSLLYEADDAMNEYLAFLKYGLETQLDDEKEIKKYGFHRIANFFNQNSAASYYYIFIEKKWKEVNDPTKVKARLDEELAVWINSYRLHAYKELEASEHCDEIFIEAQKGEIEKRISEATDVCEWIKENFDNLKEVRICSKSRANNYGTINMTIDSAKKKRHLSSKLPNIIYFKKADYRSNDALSKFLEEAKNPFGDIWYIE